MGPTCQNGRRLTKRIFYQILALTLPRILSSSASNFNTYPSSSPQNSHRPIYLRSAKGWQEAWWTHLIRYHFSQNPSSLAKSSDRNQVVSSENVNQGLKQRCLKILCRICPSHKVLPTSCIVFDLVSDKKPYATGASTDIRKGEQAGNPVRIKVFRKRTATNMEDIKCVRVLTVSGGANFDTIFNRDSTVRLWGGNTSHTRTYYPFSGFRKRRRHFVLSALGWKMGTFSITRNVTGVSIDCDW